MSERAKVYVVSGCTSADYDAACDDPRSLIEAGMASFGAPQFIGVYSLARLALRAGMDAVMKELRIDPDTEEPYLPGQDPLDNAKWVDQKGDPADLNCPLKQDTRGSFFERPEEEIESDPELWGELWGRPHYEVFLEDPQPVRTTPYDDGRSWAAIVVQEADLDDMEVAL